MSRHSYPSHHLFYEALHRQRLLLRHLGTVFEPGAAHGWAEAKKQLDTSFAWTLGRLRSTEDSGTQRPFPLDTVLNDTPPDSFLTSLSAELDAYESNLFDLMVRHHGSSEWLAELEETALLFGRKLAQETRIAMTRHKTRPGACPLSAKGSLNTISQLMHEVLHGGEFAWRPMLIRRCTDRELQYELRLCPHRKPMVSIESANVACRIGSMVCSGFAQAFFEDVAYTRLTLRDYCMDELRLPPDTAHIAHIAHIE